MLNEQYLDAEKNKVDDWKKLDSFFTELDIEGRMVELTPWVALLYSARL